MYRLNYAANYGDAEGVTITAIDFNRSIGLRIYSSGFLSYFLDRGYTADKDIQIACYDWRLAPGKHIIDQYKTLISVSFSMLLLF